MMFTDEFLTRLGLPPLARTRMFEAYVDRLVEDGEWLNLPTWGERNTIHLPLESFLQDNKWTA